MSSETPLRVKRNVVSLLFGCVVGRSVEAYYTASEAVQPLSISNNSIVYFDDGNRHVHDATSGRRTILGAGR